MDGAARAPMRPAELLDRVRRQDERLREWSAMTPDERERALRGSASASPDAVPSSGGDGSRGATRERTGG
jgi:hypothetical protein